ncbi:MAG: PBSX family phage terminase large subunit [Bacteroidales bacterium]
MGVNFDFNKIFAPVFKTDARYIDICGGRGRGGSHFATDYALFLMLTSKYFRGVFMREVFADIRLSLFQDFKDRIEEKEKQIEGFGNLFDINESRMVITCKKNGNSIISKGFKKSQSSRTANTKSLAGCTHVIIEECEEVDYSAFTQLDASLRTTKSEVQIIRVFNPPHKNHWLIREYYRLEESGQEGFYKWVPRRDKKKLHHFFATYKDNIRNINPSTVEIFEDYKRTDSDYYYTMICGLVSEGKRGRIYRNWKQTSFEEWQAIDAPIVGGLDFGYSGDPSDLVLTKRVKTKLYVHEVFCAPRLSNASIAQYIKDFGLPPSAVIYCDHEPKSQAYFSGEGIYMKQAVKGAGSIKAGIKEIQGMEVFVTAESENLWTEYEEYAWKMNLNKLPTDTPEDKNNHGMDALRMAVQSDKAEGVGQTTLVYPNGNRKNRRGL